ncbi:COG1470 family protein [Streptomyces hundungensis]|uniref:COG1470 family protein n=1 Tax=Streptomyces hundungensis TaxID=1077946 RepID=UPI0033C377C6
MRPIRLALPATALLLCALSAPAARAAPPASGEWTAAPASGGGTRAAGADGRPSFYLEGAPGTVLEDTVSLSNPSDAPLTLGLRGAAAYNTPHGDFAVRETPDPWIVLAAPEVRIPPHTRADVPFAVTVPPGAQPGDHPAALVASANGRVVGIRLQLRVSGPMLSALTVESVRVDKDHGLIRYALVNRGNTALTPRLAVRAEGVFGRVLARPARHVPVELLPGQRVELTEPWPHPPALDRVTVRLDVDADGGARSTAKASAAFVPWGAVAGAGCVLLGGAATALRLVRRRRRRPAGSAGPGEVAVAERELAQTGARQ